MAITYVPLPDLESERLIFRKVTMRCIGREVGKYVKNGIARHAVLYEITKESFLK